MSRILIGTMTAASPPIVGTLHSDGTWDVKLRGEPDATLKRIFDARYGQLGGPADGRPGAAALHRAAEVYGGTVEMPAARPTPPDTIY